MRARCLAAFDLDPKKKELAFGARTYLRLQMTMVDEHGTVLSSKWPERVPEDADVGAKMEEAQMESFDEELFNEVRRAFVALPFVLTLARFVEKSLSAVTE